MTAQRPPAASNALPLQRRPAAWLLLAAALGVAFACYGRSLRAPFTRDDDAHFADAARWQRPPSELIDHFREEFWGRGGQSGLYRPLTAASIQANAWIGGMNPAPLRAVNVALAALAAAMAGIVALRLGVSNGAAFALTLLAAAHPLLSESALEIVSRSETQAAIGVLAAAAIAATAGAPLLAAIAFGAALLSKEGAFAALPALLLLAWRRPGAGRPLRTTVALVTPLLAVLALRSTIFGDVVGFSDEQTAFLDNPLIGAPFATRLFTGVAVLGRYLAAFAWPARLSIDWSFAAIEPLHGPVDGWFAAGALALLLLGAWTVVAVRASGRPDAAASRRAEAFGLLLAGASWLLVSSIPRSVGTVMGERLFTLPLLGLLLAIAAAVDRRVRRRSARAIVALVALALAGGLAWRSHERANDWRDGLALYTAAEQVAPRSARVQCTLAHVLRERHRVAEAQPHAEKALALLPDYGKAHAELGGCLAERGEIGKAIVHLWLAARAPGHGASIELQLQTAQRRYLGEERVRAEFVRYGREVVAARQAAAPSTGSDRPSVAELHAALGREIERVARMR